MVSVRGFDFIEEFHRLKDRVRRLELRSSGQEDPNAVHYNTEYGVEKGRNLFIATEYADTHYGEIRLESAGNLNITAQGHYDEGLGGWVTNMGFISFSSRYGVSIVPSASVFGDGLKVRLDAPDGAKGLEITTTRAGSGGAPSLDTTGITIQTGHGIQMGVSGGGIGLLVSQNDYTSGLNARLMDLESSDFKLWADSGGGSPGGAAEPGLYHRGGAIYWADATPPKRYLHEGDLDFVNEQIANLQETVQILHDNAHYHGSTGTAGSPQPVFLG